MTEDRRGRSCISKEWIPARYVLTLLTFAGMCVIFSQRACLNVAMVAMVNSSVEAEISSDKYSRSELAENQCPYPEENVNITFNYQQGVYPWSPYVQGLVLGSYFYGYVVTQTIGGRVADFVGAKFLFGSATLLASFITVITPVIAEYGYIYMIVLRVALGLINGMNYPCVYTLFASWAPVEERSTLLSVCVIGTHFGIVLSMVLTGYLCEFGFAGGWPSSFYVLGVAGCVWFLFWYFLIFNTPSEHPRIRPEELKYIQASLCSVSDDKKLDTEASDSITGERVVLIPLLTNIRSLRTNGSGFRVLHQPTPWRKVITSIPVWAVTVAKFTGAWSFICFQTKLPAYIDEVLHLPIQKNGMVNALLFAALCVSMVSSGFASDRIRAKGYFRTTTIRKAFETVALVGPACCLYVIPYMKCNTTAVVVLLTSAMGLFGLCGGGEVAVIVDMAPDFAGKIFGVSNAFASIPGILAPVVAGWFLEGNKGDARQWAYVFYVSVGMYIIGAIIFLCFGSAEVQPWGVAESGSPDKKRERNKESASEASDFKVVVTTPGDLTSDETQDRSHSNREEKERF